MEDITHADYKPTKRVRILEYKSQMSLLIYTYRVIHYYWQMYSKTSITNAQKNMRLHLFIMSQYTFQSESTLYSCLYVKELLAWNRQYQKFKWL